MVASLLVAASVLAAASSSSHMGVGRRWLQFTTAVVAILECGRWCLGSVQISTATEQTWFLAVEGADSHQAIAVQTYHTHAECGYARKPCGSDEGGSTEVVAEPSTARSARSPQGRILMHSCIVSCLSAMFVVYPCFDSTMGFPGEGPQEADVWNEEYSWSEAQFAAQLETEQQKD